MTTLFRPVGLQELSLIWDSGMREFPPRLPHQPIFYPVATKEYAVPDSERLEPPRQKLRLRRIRDPIRGTDFLSRKI